MNNDENTPRPPEPDPTRPAAADPYADSEAILALINKRESAWSKPRPRRPWLMAAERNLRFNLGDQWIRPAAGGALGWRPATLPKGTPTPVTNKYGEAADAFASMLSRFEPSLNFRPSTDDPDDLATADVADRIVEVIEDEVGITPLRQMLADWVTHTGGAWLETGYDPSPQYGLVPVPLDQCAECGTEQIPHPSGNCQQGQCVGQLQPAVDPMTGEPKTQPMPRGACYTDNANLFEMFFDPMVTDGKHRGLLRKKSFPVEDMKERWPDLKDQISADSLAGGFLTAEGLALITPNIDDMGPMRSTQYGTGMTNDRSQEWRYVQLPDATYPDGLLAIALNKGKLLAYKGPLPYYATREDGSKAYFLNYVFFPQKFTPGSAWPKTVMNDVALKCAQRNLWESMILQAGFNMANAIWMVPTGSNIKPSSFAGMTGLVMEFNALGKPPVREQGMPINQSFYEQLDRLDKDVQGLSHEYDVLRGAKPAGVSAGIALQILKERGESSFGPMFILWHHAWAEWARQMLEIFRLYGTEPRVLQVMGDDGQWETQKFMAADLQGRVNVVPEAGISLPRSTMTDRATLEQLAAMGAINPQNPETNEVILQEYGMMRLAPTLKEDVKAAAIENEQFAAMAAHPAIAAEPPTTVQAMQQFAQTAQQQGMTPVQVLAQVEAKFATIPEFQGVVIPQLRPDIDDNTVHVRTQRRFAKTERYRQFPKVVQFLMELHIAAHNFLVAQAQQAMIATRQGTTATANMLAQPHPGPRPGSPPSTPAEHGASSPAGLEGQHRELARVAG